MNKPAWILALACWPALGAYAQEAVPMPAAPVHALEQGAGLELNRALRRSRDPSVAPALVVKDIAHLGAPMLEPSLLLLIERKLPAVDGGAAQVLSTVQEKLLLEGLHELNARSVWNALDAHLTAGGETPPSKSVRGAAILVGGTCARPDELRRLASLALAGGEKELDPELGRALRIASQDIFERDPEGLGSWSLTWRDHPAALVAVIAQGAGASGDPRALPFLSDLLDQGGDLEAVALAELMRQRAPKEAPQELLTQLRRRLDPARPRVCQSACNALAALGDFGSVEAIIALLGDSSASVRTTAHRALCSLSGLQLPAQAPGWHAWRIKETAWYVKHAPELYQALLEGSGKEAHEALLEIRLHRWERHELSDLAKLGLRRSETSLRLTACQVLGELASPRARAELETVAASQEAASARAASTALAALSIP